MIIIKVYGGLGNQMFQYALGLSLSQKHHHPFTIDYSYLKEANQSGRDFRLFSFKIQADEATPTEILRYTNTMQKVIDKLRASNRKKRVVEKTFTFDPTVLEKKEGYFDGHWQSAKYFESVEGLVRKEFTLKQPLGEKASVFASHIVSLPNAVSVHIRRGDYVSIGKVAAVHGTTPISYYEKALRAILEKFPDAHFFISSDDIEWAKKHFPQHHSVTFVSSPDIPDYEEMALMILCKHNIIANSTFSWWGAWLNTHKEKVVIAPKRWFLDESKDTRDLIPSSWIRL